MKISICLPVIGRERMLAQALYSILMQGYDNFEILLKDGNPDRPVMLDSEIKKISELIGNRLVYTKSRDKGIFPATNDCLKRATGDILYFMCSDDLLCPGAFEAVAKVFKAERFGGPFWVYGQTISADETGRMQGVDGEATTFDLLLQHNRLGQPSVFWNREMMNLAGMFDERVRYAADYDLWLRFWKRCDPVFINQTLGIFRHHNNQDTHINMQATETAANKVSVRHQNFSTNIMKARNAYIEKAAYGQEGSPISHDG